MNRHDDFWSRAMRSAYLTSIEQAALLPLQVQWAQPGQPDRLWAMVPVLRDDGAAQLEVLTVERVEAYARLYRARGYSINASTEPDA
jgi:hypothetical protein